VIHYYLQALDAIEWVALTGSNQHNKYSPYHLALSHNMMLYCIAKFCWNTAYQQRQNFVALEKIRWTRNF
jgi:hypothetical protein